MLSYHNDLELKNTLLANLQEHKKLDQFVQGEYWDADKKKGCAVGCSLVDFGESPSDHAAYEKVFGIPRVLARLEDGIFEGLSVEDSKWWPEAFAQAVPVGKDLSLVWHKFVVWLLDDVKKHASEDGVKAIDTVIDLYNREISGEKIDRGTWVAARRAAAAYAAAAAAAYAAAAAAAADDADAAYAAAAAAAADADAAYAYAYAYAAADADAAAARKESRKKQALKLIEILKAA